MISWLALGELAIQVLPPAAELADTACSSK